MSDKIDLRSGISLAQDGSVTFSGQSGRALLLAVLLRAKFSKPFEDITLLNRWIADLATALRDPELVSLDHDIGVDPDFRHDVARTIAAHSAELGWWKLNQAEQIEMVRTLVVAPHPISDFNAEEIVLSVQDLLHNAQRFVGAAASQQTKA